MKKVVRQVRIGLKVLRDEGPARFTLKTLLYAEKWLDGRTATKSVPAITPKHAIDTKVKYRDAIAADYTARKHNWIGTESKNLTLNWLMPPPGKGSGGHMNIYRFMQFLEEAGHTCRIYIYTQNAPGRVSDILKLMGDSYPKLKAKMVWVDSGDEMEPADGIFATSWETAYASFNADTPGKRFYFVQDFEPYFYPVGSLSSLAENTYRFGFYGVTAGGWLAAKLKRDYAMDTDFFNFGADSELYKLQNTGKRNEIFFYARPSTERRGFEMGIMALELFHREHPEVSINMGGWDVSDYDIPFPYNNLKTLEVEELNEIYNRCSAALVMSLTNMSLLPLELLSSGTIPVVNDGENNRLVSNNSFIAYSPNNPVALANHLAEIVERSEAEVYAQKASASVQSTTWEESGRKFVGIVEREVRNSG